jgi:hypothetical protein
MSALASTALSPNDGGAEFFPKTDDSLVERKPVYRRNQRQAP